MYFNSSHKSSSFQAVQTEYFYTESSKSGIPIKN